MNGKEMDALIQGKSIFKGLTFNGPVVSEAEYVQHYQEYLQRCSDVNSAILRDLITGVESGNYKLHEVTRSNEILEEGKVLSHYGFSVIQDSPVEVNTRG